MSMERMHWSWRLALLAFLMLSRGAFLQVAEAEFQIATEPVASDDGEVEVLDDAESDGEDDTFSDGSIDETLVETKKAPKPNFGPYRSGFERMCKLIRADGRQDFFYAFLVEHAVPDEECVFCEKYFRVFASACKPKKPPRHAKKSEAESPEPVVPAIPKQREPTAELVALTYTVFEQLAEDRKVDEVYLAVESLATSLTEASGQTPASRDYFQQLTAFMRLPFTEHRERLAKESSGSGGADEEARVNELFSE